MTWAFRPRFFLQRTLANILSSVPILYSPCPAVLVLSCSGIGSLASKRLKARGSGVVCEKKDASTQIHSCTKIFRQWYLWVPLKWQGMRGVLRITLGWFPWNPPCCWSFEDVTPKQRLYSPQIPPCNPHKTVFWSNNFWEDPVGTPLDSHGLRTATAFPPAGALPGTAAPHALPAQRALAVAAGRWKCRHTELRRILT